VAERNLERCFPEGTDPQHGETDDPSPPTFSIVRGTEVAGILRENHFQEVRFRVEPQLEYFFRHIISP